MYVINICVATIFHALSKFIIVIFHGSSLLKSKSIWKLYIIKHQNSTKHIKPIPWTTLCAFCLLFCRLQDSGLTHLSMEVLSQVISDDSSTLATLVLDGNEVSDLGMDWLTRALRSSKTSLQHLLYALKMLFFSLHIIVREKT